jgi:hypothetical protein
LKPLETNAERGPVTGHRRRAPSRRPVRAAIGQRIGDTRPFHSSRSQLGRPHVRETTVILRGVQPRPPPTLLPRRAAFGATQPSSRGALNVYSCPQSSHPRQRPESTRPDDQPSFVKRQSSAKDRMGHRTSAETPSVTATAPACRITRSLRRWFARIAIQRETLTKAFCDQVPNGEAARQDRPRFVRCVTARGRHLEAGLVILLILVSSGGAWAQDANGTAGGATREQSTDETTKPLASDSQPGASSKTKSDESGPSPKEEKNR